MAEVTRVAIITGAGSGIGRAAAILLAQAGWSVMLAARTRQALQETADLARAAASAADAGAGARIELLPADVSDPMQVGGLVEHTLATLGRIDAVANVAGSAPLLPIDRITPDIWRACVDVNLGSVVLMTAAVWPTFRQQQSGTIVNVSSMASIDPFPGFSIYAAAKIGVNLFTKCTADEGRAINVKAVAIAPGAVETPMLRANFKEDVLPADQTLAPRTIGERIRDCILDPDTFTSGQTIIMPSGG